MHGEIIHGPVTVAGFVPLTSAAASEVPKPANGDQGTAINIEPEAYDMNYLWLMLPSEHHHPDGEVAIGDEARDLWSIFRPTTNHGQNHKTLFGVGRPNKDSDETKKFLVQYLGQHPMLKSFCVGSFSGTCSTLLFQPFDLLKTRVQNFNVIGSGQRSAATARYMPLILEVIKNEQVTGLWRGTAPSLLRTVPGVGIHFCCLDTLQNHFCPNEKPSAVKALAFGMISRSIAAILLIPVTVVKTRYESGIFLYKNITDALRHTYRNEGLRGLSSGLLPTLLRDVPFSGLYFMFYSQFKNIAHNGLNQQQASQQLEAATTSGGSSSTQYFMNSSTSRIISSSTITFACGLSAGLMASVVTQPMDVIKTRMQLDPKQYPTLRHTLWLILKQQNVRGLFAGMVPRMARRTLMASMSWTVYEQLMKGLCLK